MEKIFTLLIATVIGLLPNILPISAEDVNTFMYENAVKDATVAEKSEIHPLVSLVEQDSNVIWDSDHKKVLMMTFHRYPSSYPKGEEIITKWGVTWSVSAGEFVNWYKDNKNDVSDWNLRLKQLLGLPSSSKNNTITLYWVDPKIMYRPAYYTNVESDEMDICFSYKPSEEYKTQFDNYILDCYYNGSIPWTRLGYTYDWAANLDEYGLTEFALPKDSKAYIDCTFGVEEFINYVEDL